MQVLALISVNIIYLKEKANMNQAGNFILIKLAIIRKTSINLSFYNKSEYFAFKFSLNFSCCKQYKERLENLYFTYSLVLRSINIAASELNAFDIDTGNE